MNDGPENLAARGLSAQFQTVARALGGAAGIMEDDLEDLAERGLDHSSATLWLESRYITVTLLSAALAEAIANAILSMALQPSEIGKAIEERLFQKWKTGISRAIGSETFLSGPLENELLTLVRTRNSIVHAKPRVFSGDNAIHDGNADDWGVLTPERVRQFVELPLLLLANVPRTPKFNFPIQSFAADYWLQQAIQRSKSAPGMSPNAWRPHTKKNRAFKGDKWRREVGRDAGTL